MHMHVYVSTHICIGTCTYVEARSQPQVSVFRNQSPRFETCLSLGPVDHLIHQTGGSASHGIQLSLPIQHWDSMLPSFLTFLGTSWESNSGPHAYTASTLLTKHPPAPLSSEFGVYDIESKKHHDFSEEITKAEGDQREKETMNPPCYNPWHLYLFKKHLQFLSKHTWCY